MRILLPAAATAALLLAGCFGGGGPSELLTLSPAQTRPAAAPRAAGPGEAVTVAEPSVPQELRTNRIPVQVDPNTVQYLTGAQWVEAPGRLFGRVLSEHIAAATGRVVLDPAQYAQDPGTRLTGHLARFGLDAQRMEAVAVYDATIARPDRGIVANRFEARVPVSADDAASVARALNEAANRLAADVTAWLPL